MTALLPKMVTFNVCGQLFTLAEKDVLKYPYSKLADVSSFTLSDDIASLNVPADSFAILAHYLSTGTFPPAPLPSTLESTFKTLGIPYHSSLSVDQHTASIGASGTLREWEARVTSPDVTSPERCEALRVIEAGLLTGRPGPTPPSASVAEAFGELPAYSDISPPKSVASKHELIPAIMQNLGSNGMSYVILIPSDELSLAAIERPSWDTGTGATDEEEVLSFATIPKEQKKVLRLPTGGGFTWDHISQPPFRSNVLQDLQQALNHVGEKGTGRGASRPEVSVWAEKELVLKNISPMGLYETRSGRAVVVQVRR